MLQLLELGTTLNRYNVSRHMHILSFRQQTQTQAPSHQNELQFGTACLDIVETSYPTTTNASKILSKSIQYIPLSESRKFVFDVTMWDYRT